MSLYQMIPKAAEKTLQQFPELASQLEANPLPDDVDRVSLGAAPTHPTCAMNKGSERKQK